MNIFLLFSDNWFTNLFLSWAAKNVDGAIGYEELTHIKEILLMSGSVYDGKSDPFTLFWSVINKALGIVEPFGYALITVYFLAYLFDAGAKENVTVDSLIKVMIQLVLVIAIMKNIDVIINTFLGVNDMLIAKISGSITGFDAKNVNTGTGAQTLNGDEVVAQWHDNGGDLAGSIFIKSFFILLLHKLAAIGIFFAGIQRAIEIGWRLALAPIGMANCFEGGMNSRGLSYLKTLACCILSGVAMYLTCSIGFALVGAYLIDGDSLFMAQVAQLGTAGAAIGVSNKVRDLA